MGQTIIEKIIQAHSDEPVKAGVPAVVATDRREEHRRGRHRLDGRPPAGHSEQLFLDPDQTPEASRQFLERKPLVVGHRGAHAPPR